MTALTLTFDQVGAGLSPGIVDRARTDIVSTEDTGGRAFSVGILIDGVPDGATADLELLDQPPASNPLLTQVDGNAWQLEFDTGVWGPFRVRARAVNSGRVVASVTRRISIRSPNANLAYPSNAERSDPNATSVASVESVALTEMNEGGTNRPLVDFYRDVAEHLELANSGTLSAVDATARSAAAAAAAAASTAQTTATSAGSTASSAASAASAAGSAATAAQSTANAAVPKALYDANTILIATVDNTPLALTVPPSSVIGRGASGDIVALNPAALGAIQVSRNPVWDAPLLADSADDEFTVDTFAAGPWIVKTSANPVVSAAYTRAGDVDPTTSPSALTFRSTLVGSTLLVQFPAGVTVIAYKPVTFAAAKQLWLCGVTSMGGLAGAAAANEPSIYFGPFGSASSLPDYTNCSRIRAYNFGGNSGARFDLLCTVAGATAVDTYGAWAAADMALSWAPGMGIYYTGAAGAFGLLFNPQGALYWTAGRTAPSFSGAGFVAFVITSTGGNIFGGSDIHALHFMRRKAVAPLIFG